MDTYVHKHVYACYTFVSLWQSELSSANFYNTVGICIHLHSPLYVDGFKLHFW